LTVHPKPPHNDGMETHGIVRWLAMIQAAYFALTGLWPIVHIHSFMKVTGPKTDLWLVWTVGVLVTVIGVAIGIAGWRGVIGPDALCLAIGSAAGLAAIDVIYVARRVIAKVYLVDALAEAILVGAWAFAVLTSR
jgi:hypothetical protein